VDNHWYVGEDMCSSKKEAEQSAAKKAWKALLAKNVASISTERLPQTSTATISEEHSDSPPSYAEAVKFALKNHLPDKYAAIEHFIATKVEEYGGRIREISPPDSQGRYKFEIGGSYRYCENVRRHHKKNQIYFIVDPIKKTYVQKCHDPECYGFQSALKNIENEQRTLLTSQENNSTDQCTNCQKPLMHQNQNECERCGEIFCKKCAYSCELCHYAVHCNRCFQLCFDSHDS
jgi:hypothetical protein